MGVLVGEGGIYLVDVDLARLGVHLEQDDFAVDCRQEYLILPSLGGHLGSLASDYGCKPEARKRTPSAAGLS